MAALPMVYLAMPVMPGTLQHKLYVLLLPVQPAHPDCHECLALHVRGTMRG